MWLHNLAIVRLRIFHSCLWWGICGYFYDTFFRKQVLGEKIIIYIIKAGVCVSVCGHLNVPTLTSPPILKLLDSQGYLWLPYDLTEVIKLIGETLGPKEYFFAKK